MSAASEQFAKALMELADQMRPLTEALNGYRAELMAQGWSPTAAEVMAMELHKHLLTQMFSSGRKQ